MKILFKGYDLVKIGSVEFENGILKTKTNSTAYKSGYGFNNDRNLYTQEQLERKGFTNVLVKLESGNKVEINKY